MTDSNFYTLWGEAIATPDRDIYVAEWSTSSIFPDGSDLLDNAYYLGQLWDAAHMTVKEICRAFGLTQAAFAQRFCIPKRTIEDWCRGARKCPDYIRLMVMELLGIIKR